MRTLDSHMFAEHDLLLVPPKAWLDDAWRNIAGQRVVPMAYKAQQHLFPVLVPIHPLSPQIQVALWERAEAWREDSDTPFIGAMVRSDRINSVASHLCRGLIFKPRGEPTAAASLVRFYDPRVYRHMRWILTAEQRATLLGPISAWSWEDREGIWRTDAQSPSVGTLPRLDYSAMQQAQLARVEWLERGLRHLAAMDPTLVNDESVVIARLDELLHQAMHTHGIYRDDDLDLYVEHAFCVHPRIHQHPQIRERLTQVGTARSYRGVCSDLSRNQLQAFATELNHPGFAAASIAAITHKEHV